MNGRRKEKPEDYGLQLPPETEQVSKHQAHVGQFVQRIYRLVPLTELEQDAYSSGGSMSGKKKPKFKEVLVTERYFEGIG